MSDNKRSCTCGECFEGWLSPTMRECLEYSAEVRYGLAKSLLDTQDGVGEDITSVLPIDYARIDNSVFYLPTAVRDKIGPSASGPSESASGSAAGDAVYRGYVAVFKAIKDLVRPSSDDSDTDAERKDFPTVSIVAARLAELRAPSSAPSSASASASAAPKDTDTDRDIAAFLDGGGQAAHALDCIVDRAREELTPLGREYDAERRYIDAMFASEYTACANDRDFALVRARLGLPARTLAVFPEDEDEEGLRDPPSDDEE